VYNSQVGRAAEKPREQQSRVNSKEAMRFLKRLGATFEPGKGSHVWVQLNGRWSQLPMHGKQEVSKGLWHRILKDLGLK
jgi:mRNA interferase HicA